jgi:hypothetical protein
MDATRFDEVMLFTSDQQGARPTEFFCRFLRVRRDAGGATPVIAFGCEGILEASGGGATEASLAEAGEVGTSSMDAEEVLRQYYVPLALLAPANLKVALAGEGRGSSEGSRNVTYRVRAGGQPDIPDGDVLLTLPDSASGDSILSADSASFARPGTPSTLIKVTGQGDGISPAVLRNFVVLFHPAA